MNCKWSLWGSLSCALCIWSACSLEKQPVDPTDEAKTEDERGGRDFNTENPFPDYTIFDHGEECFEAMEGNPLPPISCVDGVLLPVTVDGVEVTDHVPARCDNPSIVDPIAACIPGSRLGVHTSDDGKVVSMFVCRRLQLATQGAVDVESSYTENIAIMQVNRDSGATCWFQIRQHEAGIDATALVPPYEPGRVQGDARDKAATALYVPPGVLTQGETCVGCHDSQPVIRTPFVSQAKQMNPARAIPDDLALLKDIRHVGVPFEAWNDEATRAHRIRVNGQAFDALVPLTAEEQDALTNGALAAADACTRCHSIGNSPLVPLDEATQKPMREGTCNNLAREWFEAGYHGPVTEKFLSETATSYPSSHWMPPPGVGPALPTKEAWEAHYGRAMLALRMCCDDPTLVTDDGSPVCSVPDLLPF